MGMGTALLIITRTVSLELLLLYSLRNYTTKNISDRTISLQPSYVVDSTLKGANIK